MRLLLTLVLLVSCAAPQGFLLSERMSLKVVNPAAMGTAWPLTEDQFVTAWHVVKGWQPEQVEVNGVAVQSFVRLAEQDAVILVMAEPHGYTPFPLDVRELLPGERVYKSGWGQGLHWWTEGFATEDQDRLGLPICPGDSGGPVFDADGEVIGIIVAVGIAPHHCWIIPLTDLGL